MDEHLYGCDLAELGLVRDSGLPRGTFPYHKRHRWPWALLLLCLLLIAARFV